LTVVIYNSLTGTVLALACAYIMWGSSSNHHDNISS